MTKYCPQCKNIMRNSQKFDHSGEHYNQHYCQDCKRIEISKDDDSYRVSNPIRDRRLRREADRAMAIARHKQADRDSLIARHEQRKKLKQQDWEDSMKRKGKTPEESKAIERKEKYMALKQAELIRHQQAQANYNTQQRKKTDSLRTDTDPNSATFGQRIRNGLSKPKSSQGQITKIPNSVLGGLGNVKVPRITPNPNNSKYNVNPSFNPFITSNTSNPTSIRRQGGKYAKNGTPQHEHTNNPTIDDLGSNDDLKNILDDKEFVKELEKSGVDTKALNVIKERLRKKLNGELDEEKNKIPRYSEIED